MTYKLPIKITEQPHRGEPKTWTLDDEAHLKKCVDQASARRNYDDWCSENGYVSFSEDADGELVVKDDKRGELDTFLDWLRHDLSGLDVEEIRDEAAPTFQHFVKVTAENGVPFTVRMVQKGGPYGLNFALAHDADEPMVEFYDDRHKHTIFGQFVSRYNLSTLCAMPERAGLNLDGGVKEWRIDGGALSEALSGLGVTPEIRAAWSREDRNFWAAFATVKDEPKRGEAAAVAKSYSDRAQIEEILGDRAYRAVTPFKP